MCGHKLSSEMYLPMSFFLAVSNLRFCSALRNAEMMVQIAGWDKDTIAIVTRLSKENFLYWIDIGLQITYHLEGWAFHSWYNKLWKKKYFYVYGLLIIIVQIDHVTMIIFSNTGHLPRNVGKKVVKHCIKNLAVSVFCV